MSAPGGTLPSESDARRRRLLGRVFRMSGCQARRMGVRQFELVPEVDEQRAAPGR
jgi:hypothetical protein